MTTHKPKETPAIIVSKNGTLHSCSKQKIIPRCRTFVSHHSVSRVFLFAPLIFMNAKSANYLTKNHGLSPHFIIPVRACK